MTMMMASSHVRAINLFDSTSNPKPFPSPCRTYNLQTIGASFFAQSVATHNASLGPDLGSIAELQLTRGGRSGVQGLGRIVNRFYSDEQREQLHDFFVSGKTLSWEFLGPLSTGKTINRISKRGPQGIILNAALSMNPLSLATAIMHELNEAQNERFLQLSPWLEDGSLMELNTWSKARKTRDASVEARARASEAEIISEYLRATDDPRFSEIGQKIKNGIPLNDKELVGLGATQITLLHLDAIADRMNGNIQAGETFPRILDFLVSGKDPAFEKNYESEERDIAVQHMLADGLHEGLEAAKKAAGYARIKHAPLFVRMQAAREYKAELLKTFQVDEETLEKTEWIFEGAAKALYGIPNEEPLR